MHYRPVLLAIIVVISIMSVSCWAPQAKGEEDRLRIAMELDFTSLRTLGLELNVKHGLGQQGDLEQSSIGLLAAANFSNTRLTTLAQLMFSDTSVAPAQAYEAPVLINNLLFGFNTTLMVEAVTTPQILVAGNMFSVTVEKVTLSSQLSPVKIRPLVLLYQYPTTFAPSQDAHQTELEITLAEELTLTTTNQNAQYLRDFDPSSKTFSSRFQNSPPYLDPTERVDFIHYYDLKSNEIEVVEVKTYQKPTIMVAIYLVCLLLSLILLKVVGRKYTDKRGYPLSLGIFGWLIIGLVFFMAFIPSSAELFLSLCLGGLLLSLVKLRGGKRLDRRGGARRGPRLEPVGKQDLNLYRKPGKKPTLEAVDGGSDGGDPDGFGLDSLMGGGGDREPEPSLESLDGTGADEGDDFKPPARDTPKEAADPDDEKPDERDEDQVPDEDKAGKAKEPATEGEPADRPGKKVKKIKKGKKVKKIKKKGAKPFDEPAEDEKKDSEGEPGAEEEEPEDTTSAADLLDELVEKPDEEDETGEDFSDLMGIETPDEEKEVDPLELGALPDSMKKPDDEEALPELTRKPITKGDKSALASRLAALDDLKKKL